MIFYSKGAAQRLPTAAVWLLYLREHRTINGPLNANKLGGDKSHVLAKGQPCGNASAPFPTLHHCKNIRTYALLPRVPTLSRQDVAVCLVVFAERAAVVARSLPSMAGKNMR